jgi:hypothetical protein
MATFFADRGVDCTTLAVGAKTVASKFGGGPVGAATGGGGSACLLAVFGGSIGCCGGLLSATAMMNG